MVMFKTLYLRLQIARGRKQVYVRATSRAESYYPPRMIVGATGLAIDWAPMRLVVPFVEQVRGW